MRASLKFVCVLVLSGVSHLSATVLGQPLSAEFTYQGVLRSAGAPATGTHDLQFRLFSVPAGGSPLGGVQCRDNVALADGRFTVLLSFGAQFDGQQRFLEIEVRTDTGLDCTNTTGYTTLIPRQPLTATPHALFALGAAAAVSATTAASAADAALLNGQPGTFYRNASNINAGTLPDARLSFNVALLSANQTFTGANTFSNPANVFVGNGAGLTNLNANNITTGTLADARLSANVALLNANQTFTGANTFGNAGNVFVGNGAGLTALNASNITTGTLADARLSANIARLNGNQTFTGANNFANGANVFVGSGAGLTSLDASNITTGTLADARLSSNVPLKNTSNDFGNFTNFFAGHVGVGASDPVLSQLQVVAQGRNIGVNVYNALPGGWAIRATATGADGTGVTGLASPGAGISHGVHGESDSTVEAASGVKGEGNGVTGPGVPAAAAIEISNGAITVTGAVRPAGTILAGGPWICMDSWQNPPGPVPPHCHPIGAFKDVVLDNPLIKPDSIILLTVVDLPPPPGKACFVQVLTQSAGTANLRVAVMGSTQCIFPCSYFGPVRVHYLIVNPL